MQVPVSVPCSSHLGGHWWALWRGSECSVGCSSMGRKCCQGMQEKRSQKQNDRSAVRSFIPESLHLEGPGLVYLGLKARCLHNAPSPGVFKGLWELIWVWLCLQYNISNSTTLCSFLDADFNLKPSDLSRFSVALTWTQWSVFSLNHSLTTW